MKGSRLTFEEITFRRGSFRLEANTYFNEGKFTVVLGPSGSGKTTMLDLAAGFLLPSGGRILEGERDVTRLPPERRSVGVVFQDYALFPHLNVRGNIAYGPKARGLSRREAAAVANRFMEMTHLAHLAERNPSSLSGGERQRVALARALAIEPDILLLDEPFSSLDASLRVSLRRDVKRIQEETGVTSILVTHDQDEALSLADDLAIMNNGRIIQQSAPSELWKNPKDLFTAQFLGRTSRLSVKRYEINENRTLMAHTAAGPIPVPADIDPPPPPATVIFRPEDLIRDEKGDLTAILERCEYAGGSWKGHLVPREAHPGDVLEIDFPRADNPPPVKKSIKLRLSRGAVRILPGTWT